MQSDKLNRALEFATKMHDGQVRKGGEPYITHPVAVAQYLKKWGYDESYQIIGLFHDLLEDTSATEEEILELGGAKVLETVKLLTKEKDYDMNEYIRGIKANEMARIVKTADRLHNLRSAVHTEEAFKRKYIAESKKWYQDFSPDIVEAIEELEKTLEV